MEAISNSIPIIKNKILCSNVNKNKVWFFGYLEWMDDAE